MKIQEHLFLTEGPLTENEIAVMYPNESWASQHDHVWRETVKFLNKNPDEFTIVSMTLDTKTSYYRFSMSSPTHVKLQVMDPSQRMMTETFIIRVNLTLGADSTTTKWLDENNFVCTDFGHWEFMRWRK